MIPDDLPREDYRYAGETIELEEPLSAEQFAALCKATGWPDRQGGQRGDGARVFEPQLVSEGERLRDWLRTHGVAHTSELAVAWAPSHTDHENGEGLQALLELARGLELADGALDEALYEAEAPSASQINDNGLEAQLRWLLSVNDVARVSRLIEEAAAGDG